MNTKKTVVFVSSFAADIREYLDFRESIGRSACHTGHLMLFDQYCHDNYSEEAVLSKQIVLGWIGHEASKENNALSYKASAIRLFAMYLGHGAYILPADYVTDKSSFAPHIFTDAELSALFIAADNITMQGGRDPFLRKTAPVLLRLLYTCGLRPMEGRLLKRKNINFDTGEILITKTKGHKERMVVMSDDMLDLCRQYDAERRVCAGDCEYFFVLSTGTNVPRSQFWSLFRSCWAKANPGIQYHLLPQACPYDLRHRFASTVLHNWLDEGRDMYAMLPYLRTYMGHENFSDTAYYIHLLPERLLKSPGVDWDALDAVIPEVDIWST